LLAANLDRLRKRWFILLAIIVPGCVVLESAQLFESGRHARLTDVVLNVISAAGGFAFGVHTAIGGRLCQKLSSSRMHRPIAQIAVLTGTVLVWLIIGLRPLFGAINMEWDRTFPFCLANEIGGARQWSGQIRYAGIYDRGLSPSDVQQLYRNLGQPN